MIEFLCRKFKRNIVFRNIIIVVDPTIKIVTVQECHELRITKIRKLDTDFNVNVVKSDFLMNDYYERRVSLFRNYNTKNSGSSSIVILQKTKTTDFKTLN